MMQHWSQAIGTKDLKEASSAGLIGRNIYEREYDKVIFSSHFRRLQNKTQVFPMPGNIFVHNRLTHSLEVASVGRSIAREVGRFLADKYAHDFDPYSKEFYRFHLPSVISTACLAHDIGNPAFGHSGEAAIGEYFIQNSHLKKEMTPEEWEDLCRFEGNANAFRILTKKFKNRLQNGLELKDCTLASLIKYPCGAHETDKKAGIHRKKFNYFQADKARFLELMNAFPLPKDERAATAFYRHPFVYMVEAADDICYQIIDWEDAHRLGILSHHQIVEVLMGIVKHLGAQEMEKIECNLKGLQDDPNEKVAYLRAKSLQTLIQANVEVFIHHEVQLLQGSFPKALSDGLPESLKDTLAELQKLSLEKIYNHDAVVKKELSGAKILYGLIEDFLPAALSDQKNVFQKKINRLIPSQFQSDVQQSTYEKCMNVLDFISGMTDAYAVELYKNIRGISLPE